MVFDKIKTFKNTIEQTENIPKMVKKLEKQIDSHQRLFSNLYLYHTLEPTHYLQSLKDISYELMLFVDNICQKHNLDWWLDFGTLLGAVRHQGNS